jgi:hypothetical protein
MDGIRRSIQLIGAASFPGVSSAIMIGAGER